MELVVVDKRNTDWDREFRPLVVWCPLMRSAMLLVVLPNNDAWCIDFYNKCVGPCLVPACTARIIIFLLSVSKFWFLGNKVGNICLWRLCCDNLGGALPWWLGWQDANRWKFAFEWASVRDQGQCRCRASILANQTWDNWWALIGGVLECYPTHVWLINDTHQTIT